MENVQHEFTESVSQQHELVTTRQMENWQWDVNVRPTWFSLPSEPQSITPPALLMISDRLTRHLLWEFTWKQARVLISRAPNSIQLMHILLVCTKQNRRRTISFPSTYTHWNWNVSQQKSQKGLDNECKGNMWQKLFPFFKRGQIQRDHLLLDMNLIVM